MTTPAFTPQQRALIIAAAYRRPVLEALRLEQRRAAERMAQPELACGARVGVVVQQRRDCRSATTCRAPGAGPAADQIEKRAARP